MVDGWKRFTRVAGMHVCICLLHEQRRIRFELVFWVDLATQDLTCLKCSRAFGDLDLALCPCFSNEIQSNLRTCMGPVLSRIQTAAERYTVTVFDEEKPRGRGRQFHLNHSWAFVCCICFHLLEVAC